MKSQQYGCLNWTCTMTAISWHDNMVGEKSYRFFPKLRAIGHSWLLREGGSVLSWDKPPTKWSNSKESDINTKWTQKAVYKFTWICVCACMCTWLCVTIIVKGYEAKNLRRGTKGLEGGEVGHIWCKYSQYSYKIKQYCLKRGRNGLHPQLLLVWTVKMDNAKMFWPEFN